MTQETQETIKFARHWLEIANKHGDPNAPTTGCMAALAKAVVALTEELQVVVRANMDNLEALDHQEFLLDKANAELAELKDKARWRKQSEEPAPEGEEVLIRYTDYDDGNYYDIVKMEDMYDPDGELAYPLMWWRPLDLPEESKEE